MQYTESRTPPEYGADETPPCPGVRQRPTAHADRRLALSRGLAAGSSRRSHPDSGQRDDRAHSRRL